MKWVSAIYHCPFYLDSVYFTMNREKEFEKLFNTHFAKQKKKTCHETLANYYETTRSPIAGKEDGDYYTHINYHTMKLALSTLLSQNRESNIFVETGCSAHGTKSTLLWDKFVNKFNGKVISVDLNKNAVNLTNKQTLDRTTVICSNSLNFLPTITEKIDFLYLDSCDVDFLKPKLSAEHHLKEFNCIKHLLHKGSVVLIDDTPCTPEWLDNGINNRLYEKIKKQFNPNMCGKGSLVSQELKKLGATKIAHQYQVLWIL